VVKIAGFEKDNVGSILANMMVKFPLSDGTARGLLNAIKNRISFRQLPWFSLRAILRIWRKKGTRSLSFIFYMLLDAE
jgi:hypothetical protein